MSPDAGLEFKAERIHGENQHTLTFLGVLDDTPTGEESPIHEGKRRGGFATRTYCPLSCLIYVCSPNVFYFLNFRVLLCIFVVPS